MMTKYMNIHNLLYKKDTSSKQSENTSYSINNSPHSLIKNLNNNSQIINHTIKSPSISQDLRNATKHSNLSSPARLHSCICCYILDITDSRSNRSLTISLWPF